jgi:large subunit ribosomal protein L18
MFKRRRYKKTDYKQRLALLRSGKPRIVVRRSLDNIHIQIIRYEPAGDKTVVDVLSKKLAKYGWKAHTGNTSAAYLCGLVAGLDAGKKGIDTAVADTGLQVSTKGSVIYAALVGARDAGLKINLGNENLPDIKRISGSHIAEYAKMLKANKEKYNKQFSAYIKNGVEPEKIVEHFEEVKKNIMKAFGFELTKKEETVEKGDVNG